MYFKSTGIGPMLCSTVTGVSVQVLAASFPSSSQLNFRGPKCLCPCHSCGWSFGPWALVGPNSGSCIHLEVNKKVKDLICFTCPPLFVTLCFKLISLLQKKKEQRFSILWHNSSFETFPNLPLPRSVAYTSAVLFSNTPGANLLSWEVDSRKTWHQLSLYRPRVSN